MSPTIVGALASGCFGAAAYFAVGAGSQDTTVGRAFSRYRSWWCAQCAQLHLADKAGVIPAVQVCSAVAAILCGVFSWDPRFTIPALVIAIGPPVVLHRKNIQRTNSLSLQLDGTVVALANALSATPNLGDALRSIVDNIESPMRDEIRSVLAEVKLGRPLDDALSNWTMRTPISGLDSAVAAAITGRRTGGDLPKILKGTATTIREMARLEGVLKTKTSEGRNQAIVMGLVPLALVGALQKIDPGWLEPMWNDPIGWILLGAATVLELAAIALIRKIMAVEL